MIQNTWYRTLTRAARTTWCTLTKVASSVFTASQFDEERTLTGTPSGFAAGSKGDSGSEHASGSEGASSSKEASRYKEASASHGSIVPAAAFHSASSDKVDSVYSTPEPLIDVPTPIADQPNRCCVEGQYLLECPYGILIFSGILLRQLI